MQSYLRVKIKSLAEESRIIRHEERLAAARRRRLIERQRPHSDEEFNGLHRHRTYDVRNEARAAQLALGFIRQRPYRVMEGAGSSRPPITRLIALVKKYSNTDPKAIEAWLKA